MEELKFLQGLSKNLPSNRTSTSVYVTTDDGKIYIGNNTWNSKVDATLSSSSTNPIMNGTVTLALTNLEGSIDVISSSTLENHDSIENMTSSFTKISGDVETLKNEMIEDELVTHQVFSTLKTAISLNENLQFEPVITAKYISGATSVMDALLLLNNAIVNLENKK